MINEVYYTIREVAEILKVKETTVRHNIKTGQIAANKTIGGWRITETELKRLLKGE